MYAAAPRTTPAYVIAGVVIVADCETSDETPADCTEKAHRRWVAPGPRGRQPARFLTWPYGHGYVIEMPRMPAGKFKDQCLKVLDEVAATRTPVTITKRGKPVATVVPYTARTQTAPSLAGSILEERGDPFGAGESWNADRS
jgi:prevent-host-death family protein